MVKEIGDLTISSYTRGLTDGIILTAFVAAGTMISIWIILETNEKKSKQAPKPQDEF